MGQNQRRKRKSKLQILQLIKEFIEESESIVFHKSDLKTKNIDSRTAEEFLKIIHFCQRQIPPLQIIKTEHSFIARVLDHNIFRKELEEQYKSKKTVWPIDNRRFKYYPEFEESTTSWTPKMANKQNLQLQLKFKCIECAKIVDMPKCTYCGDPMDIFDTDKKLYFLAPYPDLMYEERGSIDINDIGSKILRCEVCERHDVVQEIPKHCGKTMKAIINKDY